MTKTREPGRAPVRWSPALGKEICARLAKGDKWHVMSREAAMPSYSVLYKWMDAKPEFAADVRRAYDMNADRNADEALVIAEATTTQTVSADRLKVSTLLKLAALRAPHRWGSKAAAGETEPQRKMKFYIKRFERVVLKDGTTVIREAKPEWLK